MIESNCIFLIEEIVEFGQEIMAMADAREQRTPFNQPQTPIIARFKSGLTTI